jgi:sugar phosphate isomerase/epimerase
LGLVANLEIASRAGYRGVEPWIREIDQYTSAGGTLPDLAKRIRDLGLSVESVIGFAEWIVDDDARRARGLEEARRNMDLVLAIGGTRLAAPPAGATDVANLDLRKAAQRYRALLEIGAKRGVTAQLEVWGFSKTLGRLGDAVFVAIECGHPSACLLPDVYHLHKGGSGIGGFHLVAGSAIHVFHMNDYPAEPPRETITDADRVFPGDGVAPLTEMLRTLRDVGFRGMLSLEVFNRDYWRQDAFEVAQMGLVKMRAAVRKALA